MNRNNGRKIAERLMLLQDYFIKNADKTHAVSMEAIRRHYLDNGIEGENSELMNIKTVYRDLDALGAYYGLDIAYSEKHKGYILRNPPFEAYELRLIVDSVQASKFITQTEAKKLTEKITKNFGSGRRQNLNRRAYVYDRIRSQNDSVVKQTDRIHEAIAADRKIGFLYFHLRLDRKKEYSNSGKQIIVSPFALYWNGGNLYLYAYDGKKFRFYRVDRMEAISESESKQTREGHDLFSAKSLTHQKKKEFDMYSTGKVYNVKFRCHNHIAPNVIDQFGKDIMMMTDDDEHFTFTYKVDISPPFFAWVATFGHSIKILSPDDAVKGMRDFLQKSIDMYKDDGNT